MLAAIKDHVNGSGLSSSSCSIGHLQGVLFAEDYEGHWAKTNQRSLGSWNILQLRRFPGAHPGYSQSTLLAAFGCKMPHRQFLNYLHMYIQWYILKAAYKNKYAMEIISWAVFFQS